MDIVYCNSGGKLFNKELLRISN